METIKKQNNTEVMPIEDWTKVHEDGMIHVPDELDPLINSIGIQLHMHTISGKSEGLTICHIAFNAQKFFHKMYSEKLEQVKAEREWINVKDELPKQKNKTFEYSEYVLAFSDKLFGKYFISRYDHQDETWSYDTDHDEKHNPITHWTPLLAKPF